MTIDSKAATADRAASLNAAATKRELDAVSAKVDGNGSVDTAGYSLNPVYSNAPAAPRPSNYLVSQVHDPDRFARRRTWLDRYDPNREPTMKVRTSQLRCSQLPNFMTRLPTSSPPRAKWRRRVPSSPPFFCNSRDALTREAFHATRSKRFPASSASEEAPTDSLINRAGNPSGRDPWYKSGRHHHQRKIGGGRSKKDSIRPGSFPFVIPPALVSESVLAWV
jgi:hypothetical protein